MAVNFWPTDARFCVFEYLCRDARTITLGVKSRCRARQRITAWRHCAADDEKQSIL